MPLGNGTYHPANISFWDKSKESSSFGVYGTNVTAANLDAQATLWAALVAASNGLTLGLLHKARWVNEVISNANPDVSAINQGAAREIKLLIQSVDTSQARYTATLPTLDLSLVTYLAQAKDFIAITTETGAGAEVMAFIDAYEGYAKSPGPQTALTIIGLKVVGRNN